MMRRLLRRAGMVIGAVVVLGIASIPFTAPVLAAYACPGCYGLEKAARGIYVEKGHDPAPLIENFKTARERVGTDFAITDMPDATFLVCGTEACDARLGGKGARATTYGASMIRVSPRGWDETILTHEMAHIVLHDAVGTWGLLRGQLPAWRDEGIAVLVSRDARYFDFKAKACRAELGDALPETPGDWAKAMRPDTHRALYSQAACAVYRQHGLPPYDLSDIVTPDFGDT